MNAILSLSHFCETHGPTTLFTTQAFHFVGENSCGKVEPLGTQFFGCVAKLEHYNTEVVDYSSIVNCEACKSTTGYLTNDYESKTSFLSTRLALDSNVSSALKQAAIRSLSCEIVPGREGQVYFGDALRGHILSYSFFLKDARARGFHRWYSIIVFMKDKHFLLNSSLFFEMNISPIVNSLKKKAIQVYYQEQNYSCQCPLRLPCYEKKHSTSRSLIELTSCSSVFAQLHLGFTWILSIGAKRLEDKLKIKPIDFAPFVKLDKNRTFFKILSKKSVNYLHEEKFIQNLRNLRIIFGTCNFQKIIYSTQIGRQIIIRGPKMLVDLIIKLLRLFLPRRKFVCAEFEKSYKTPDICNVLGLDLFAAVPKSSETLVRLDIIPFKNMGNKDFETVIEACEYYRFMIKNESKLPEKLPTLLLKIDKALSDNNLTNRMVWLHLTSLMEQWLNTADVILEIKRNKKEFTFPGILRYFGIQDQDLKLIEYWTS